MNFSLKFFAENKEFFSEVLVPICTSILPLMLLFYTKLRQEIKKGIQRFLISFESRLTQWENEFSGEMHKNITINFDRVKVDPYTSMDQIVMLSLADGVSAMNNIHLMFWSVTSETTTTTRIPKLTHIQRVPFTEFVNLYNKIGGLQEDAIHGKHLEIPDMNAIDDLKRLPLFENVGSSLLCPVVTPDGFQLGLLMFNYKDTFYNDGELDIEVTRLRRARNFVEGEVLAYMKKREWFIRKEGGGRKHKKHNHKDSRRH